MSLDRRIEALEREAQVGVTPELLTELAQLYQRVDRPESALGAYQRALKATRGIVADLHGAEDLHPLRPDLVEAIEALEEEVARRAQRKRSRARLAELAAVPEPGAEERDERIRLELELGLPITPEPAACPACQGPLKENPEQAGAVQCARTGEGGDLCRHMDASNLFACGGCGLVVRSWNDRRLGVPDEHEPPLLRPERIACPHCNVRVADWSKHYRRCPQARPGEFPICEVCRKRGYHRGPLRCPRCSARVGETPCSQKRH